MVLSMGRQSLDLQGSGDLHKVLKLVVLNMDHALIHELQQGIHHLIGNVFEDDCRLRWMGVEVGEEGEIIIGRRIFHKKRKITVKFNYFIRNNNYCGPS